MRRYVCSLERGTERDGQNIVLDTRNKEQITKALVKGFIVNMMAVLVDRYVKGYTDVASIRSRN